MSSLYSRLAVAVETSSPRLLKLGRFVMWTLRAAARNPYLTGIICLVLFALILSSSRWPDAHFYFLIAFVFIVGIVANGLTAAFVYSQLLNITEKQRQQLEKRNLYDLQALSIRAGKYCSTFDKNETLPDEVILLHSELAVISAKYTSLESVLHKARADLHNEDTNELRLQVEELKTHVAALHAALRGS